MKIISRSNRQTRKIAADLAKSILKPNPPAGGQKPKATVVALSGELGAGKTTFTQGFAKTLGIRRRIASPTFLIFKPYTLNAKPYTRFYHVDAYRLKNPKEITDLGFKKILADPRNIVLIEWAEKIKKLLPKNTIWIHFHHGRKESERTISLKRLPRSL